ncbi:MAG TPA: NAD-dependent epimerase/dehydratase family protein, partial [Candidatus Poseidoniales archaeon]
MHLVTGGAGFIGSHLVDRLVSKGEKVRVIDNLSSGRIDFIEGHIGDSVEIVIADLLDIDRLSDAMEGVTTVHHLAANPDIRLGTKVTDTDLKQGTIATYNV